MSVWQSYSIRATADNATHLRAWEWRIGSGHRLLFYNLFGDAFLNDGRGGLFLLDVGTGDLIDTGFEVGSVESAMLAPNVREDFLRCTLVDELRRVVRPLAPHECYGFSGSPPLLGGAYAPDNLAPIDLAVQHQLLAQLARQAASAQQSSPGALSVGPATGGWEGYVPQYTRYRHLAIADARPAPSVAEVAAIETALGAKLPASFRQFLDVASGGHLEYAMDVAAGDAVLMLSFSELFSAEGAGPDTFVGETRAARERDVPKGVLPFARDGGESVVYLDLSPAGAGRVVAFVEERAGRAASGLVSLAASFDEYVDRLRLDRDAVLDHLQLDATEPAQVDALQQALDIGLPDWRTDAELASAVDDARRRVSGDGATEPTA